MGIDAATRRDDGSRVKVPSCNEDWRSWVSAGRTRNWMLDDPLIDWLQLYGKNHDYISRREAEGYDNSLDFTAFIFNKGQEFEAGVLQLLEDRYEVATIAQDFTEISRLGKAQETFEAMSQGVPHHLPRRVMGRPQSELRIARFYGPKRCPARSVPRFDL